MFKKKKFRLTTDSDKTAWISNNGWSSFWDNRIKSVDTYNIPTYLHIWKSKIIFIWSLHILLYIPGGREFIIIQKKFSPLRIDKLYIPPDIFFKCKMTIYNKLNIVEKRKEYRKWILFPYMYFIYMYICRCSDLGYCII